MYIIKVEDHFDGAHFLAGYEGKCSNIHGHCWRVEVEVQTEQLIDEGQRRGMVTDFADAKRDLKQIVDYFDHALIIEEGSMKNRTLNCLIEDGYKVVSVSFRTTAENFACYFYESMKEKGYDVKRVKVFETVTNCAIYEK